jgi:aminoglycoside phosphotransferase (APT) family kinase protein
MDVAALLRHVNQQHGRAFSLVAKCDGGTRGAYEVAEGKARAILKFGRGQGWLTRIRRAESIAGPLRASGYPSPRNLVLGIAPDDSWYQVQELVPGAPMSAPLSPADLELLLALNDLQADRRASTEEPYPDWSRYILDVVFAGASGWTDALRSHSGETRALLAALQSAAAPHAATPLPSTDVVHGDFLPENVLVCDGHVSAVIDTAAMGYGTRVHDLARVLVWWYDDMVMPLRRRLADRLTEITLLRSGRSA